MNKITIIGNLTADPIVSITPSKVHVARFTVAVRRKYKNADGTYDVDFIRVVAWRGFADVVEKYLSKGKKVCVVGSMQFRTYEDKEKIKRTVGEIIAEDVEFLSAASKEPTSASIAEVDPVVDDDDNLPF